MSRATTQADINRRWIRLNTTVLKKAVDNIGHVPSEEDKVGVASTRFHDMAVEQPAHLGEGDIQTFEAAREVFLRCTARLEVAKKEFPMDGECAEEQRRGEEKIDERWMDGTVHG
jgi:hypothetical protein